MDTGMIKKDLEFQPIQLDKMLDTIIEQIIKDPPNLL
jgi:hypothetical protein